jgi:hypothetical protein
MTVDDVLTLLSVDKSGSLPLDDLRRASTPCGYVSFDSMSAHLPVEERDIQENAMDGAALYFG